MKNSREEDIYFLKATAKLSLEKMREGKGGPFACLIVKDGQILSEGYNEVTSSNDPTAHAEVQAIRKACQKLNNFQLSGCTVYTSCEPCPMCLGALYWARPDRVVFSNTRHDAAIIGFDDDFIYQELKLDNSMRQKPMEHIPLSEALVAFKEWKNKEDKVVY